MLKLDAVNRLLGYAGLTPVSSLVLPHSRVPSAVALLDRHSRTVQGVGGGFWFNREVFDLSPDATDGHVYVPDDVLQLTVLDRSIKAVQRGRTLLDLASNTRVFTRKVKVRIIRLIPFDELPEAAADYISLCAALEFHRTIDGDTATRQEIEKDKAMAHARLEGENTRQSRENLHDGSYNLRRLRSASRNHGVIR